MMGFTSLTTPTPPHTPSQPPTPALRSLLFRENLEAVGTIPTLNHLPAVRTLFGSTDAHTPTTINGSPGGVLTFVCSFAANLFCSSVC